MTEKNFNQMTMTRIFKRVVRIIETFRFLLDNWNHFSDAAKWEILEALVEDLSNAITPVGAWDLILQEIDGIDLSAMSPEIKIHLQNEHGINDDEVE